MKRFWTREGSFNVEGELRRSRPEPREEFVRMVADRVRGEGRRRVVGLRLALVSALTAALLVPLAAFGGFTYAASGVKSSFSALTGGGSAKRVTAAQNQYAGEKCLVEHRTRSGKTRTIFVNPHAVPAHRRHGDTVIVCPAP